MAWRRGEFRDFFDSHAVRIPMDMGDILFMSPALFHAAGSNETDNVFRMANLLQVSSAFGRAMETVDRTRMCGALFPVLKRLINHGSLDETSAGLVIAASAEGYPFPTNLDRDPPIDGLAPQTQQVLMQVAIDKGWSNEQFAAAQPTIRGVVGPSRLIRWRSKTLNDAVRHWFCSEAFLLSI